MNGREISNLTTKIAAATLNTPNWFKVHFPFPDMYDADKTGTIDLQEFQKLFSSVNEWKAIFQSHDKDRSGRIDQNELTQGK